MFPVLHALIGTVFAQPFSNVSESWFETIAENVVLPTAIGISGPYSKRWSQHKEKNITLLFVFSSSGLSLSLRCVRRALFLL